MFILEIAILIITILAGVYSLRSWWMASEQPAETTPDGSYMLRYSRNTFWLGLISLLAGSGLVGSAWILEGPIETVISLILMGSGLVIGGFWLKMEYYNNRLIVNNRYVRKRRWLGGDTIIDWARLEMVKFSSRSGTFVLIDMNGEKIKVSRLMRGFKQFEEVMDQQVSPKKVDQASMEDYQKLQKLEKELIEEFQKSTVKKPDPNSAKYPNVERVGQ